MNIQPTDNISFNAKIYKFTKYTSYGRRIHGVSKGQDYDVYVGQDQRTGRIEHKLYCIFKDNKWQKSFLRYFSGDKLSKELRSSANERKATNRMV